MDSTTPPPFTNRFGTKPAPGAHRCEGFTMGGKRCRRTARKGTEFCDQHQQKLVPVKFQLDATGMNVLAYSEDKTTVHAFSDDPAFVLQIESALSLKPMSKAYAMAALTPEGVIAIGDKLDDQYF